MLNKNNVDLCATKLENSLESILEQKKKIEQVERKIFGEKLSYQKNLENRIIQIIDLVKKNKNKKNKIFVNLNSCNQNLKPKIIKNSNNENYLKNISLINSSKKEDINNKRKGSEITQIEENKKYKKNKNLANFFIRQKNNIIPVFIPKIKNTLSLRRKKK